MKRFGVLLTTLAVVGCLCGAALAADTLDQVRKRGVLVAGVQRSAPPFSFADPGTGAIIGYDVDFCKAVADRIGVKLSLKTVSSENRIPRLVADDCDLVAATMTITEERAKQIDFSYVYFLTGQKFLTEKGKVKGLVDLVGKKIATLKGTTSEKNVRRALPTAEILFFEDYPSAFQALLQGKVAAVTTDESILAGLLGKAPNQEFLEIPDVRISEEPYGIGVRKGDKGLLDVVNLTLLEMEKSGEAARIFDKWFGPGSDTPLHRTFRIIGQ